MPSPKRREPGRTGVEDLWKKQDKTPSARYGKGKRWRVRWVDYDGAQKSKSFDRKVDAEKFENQIISELVRGDYIDRNESRTTVGAMYSAWLPSQVHLKEKTRYNIQSKWNVHLQPKWANREVGSIRRPDISTWVAASVEAGVGAATIEQAIGILKRVLDYAVDAGKLSSNPAIDVKVPRAKKRAHTYLTIDQVDKLASEVGEHETLIRVLAFCGLRWGEASALRVKDIDLARRRISVHTTDSDVGGRIQDSTPKSHKIRSVPFPETLLPYLRERTIGKKPTDRLFATERGTAINPSNFRDRVYSPAIERLKESGEFPRLRIHDLRHTCASLAVASGANVKAVQRMLGHASASLTLDTYADLFDTDLDLVAGRMDHLINRERLRCVLSVYQEIFKATPLIRKVALTCLFS